MVSKITNPPSQVDLVDKVNEIIDDKQDKLNITQLSYYGTCSTSASTKAKVVVCPEFAELKTGVSIRVKFTSGQSYSGMATLNVNSTGAINVKSIGTTDSLRYCWNAGEIVSFTYDGANWLMEDAGTATTTYYGYTKLVDSATSTLTSSALTPSSLNQLVLNMIEPYPLFSTSETYQVGDRVRRNYNAWECVDDIPEAGAWDETQWIALDPIQDQIDAKQATLVSGTNIKTVDGNSLLGSGNITVGVGYGTSSSAATDVQKEVSIPSITTLNEGQIIVIQPTITSTVANSTLKLNDFDAYPMRYNGAAITTTTDSVVWSASFPSQFIFDGDYWVFLGHGVDNNTTVISYSYDSGKYTAGIGAYAVNRYALIAQKDDGTWERLTDTTKNYSTATTKTVNTRGFILNQLRYYSATGSYSNGAKITSNIIQQKASSVNTAYSFNCGTAPGWTEGDYIYLVGTIGVDGLFYLDTTTWWSNALPSTNDGKLYIRLGLALTSTDATISFFDDRPIFYHNGIKICEYKVADNKQDILVSGTNIKTINNTSLLGSGNIDIAGGSVLVDDVTISRDSNQKLQAIGVINSRDSSTAIKTWTGTKAQYDAIASKDANTLYNITDDSDVSLTILEALYPVGSVYITTANTCPLSALISGSTWELVSSGRVLQGADSGHNAGTTIEAGLPNIEGRFKTWGTNANIDGTSGAFYTTDVDTSTTKFTTQNGLCNGAGHGNFDASRYSSIYGNSSTGQPPAYVVNVYRRTA